MFWPCHHLIPFPCTIYTYLGCIQHFFFSPLFLFFIFFRDILKYLNIFSDQAVFVFFFLYSTYLSSMMFLWWSFWVWSRKDRVEGTFMHYTIIRESKSFGLRSQTSAEPLRLHPGAECPSVLLGKTYTSLTKKQHHFAFSSLFLTSELHPHRLWNTLENPSLSGTSTFSSFTTVFLNHL